MSGAFTSSFLLVTCVSNGFITGDLHVVSRSLVFSMMSRPSSHPNMLTCCLQRPAGGIHCWSCVCVCVDLVLSPSSLFGKSVFPSSSHDVHILHKEVCHHTPFRKHIWQKKVFGKLSSAEAPERAVTQLPETFLGNWFHGRENSHLGVALCNAGITSQEILENWFDLITRLSDTSITGDLIW